MAHEDEFDELVQSLRDQLSDDTAALELWEDIQVHAKDEFLATCGWHVAVGHPQSATVAFLHALHTAITTRSLHIAAEEVVRRQSKGEEISDTMNATAFMLAERDNNTPEYQRRLRLLNTARQLAGQPAL